MEQNEKDFSVKSFVLFREGKKNKSVLFSVHFSISIVMMAAHPPRSRVLFRLQCQLRA